MTKASEVIASEAFIVVDFVPPCQSEQNGRKLLVLRVCLYCVFLI